MPTRHRLAFVPLNQATGRLEYLKVSLRQIWSGTPLIGTDGELPAGEQEAIFTHYCLTYQPGAAGRSC